jgi:DNA-binding CsgD family transcriptional regulator
VDGHCAGDLDVILAIDTAADAEQAIAVAAKHLMSIGLGHFFTGTMQGHNCSGAIAITHHHVSHAPLGWMLHYRDCGYQSIDPLVKATGKRHLSFFWSDLSQSQPFQQEGVRRMFDEGREFRITNGFVMPLHRADGTVHALSAMAEDIDIDNPHIRAKAKAVSVALLHRLDAFGMTTIAQSLDVDDCERDCLSRILEGRTSDELARRMSLDEQSAIQLVSRVCAKFGTTDPLEAALRARRSKLICL